MPARKRPSSPRADHSLQRSWDAPVLGFIASLAVAVGLIVSDIIEGPFPRWLGVVAVVPFIGAAMLSPLMTAVVGLLVTVAIVAVTPIQSDIPGDTMYWPTRLRAVLVAAASVLAIIVAVGRERGGIRTQKLALVASAAQDALMRPVPPVVGPLRCATRYQSALEYARIGGDLIEVMRTDFGIRILVGDVQGKGMPAVRLAGAVLGSFRELAFTVPDLAALAASLTRSVERVSNPEEFVTGAMLQIGEGGRVEMVLAGHPAPFVVEVGEVAPARQQSDGVHDPPLGLVVTSCPQVLTWWLKPGERLVLTTDGVLEARQPVRWWMRGPLRRPRPFFPAAEVIGRELSHGDTAKGLDELFREVNDWTGHTRGDDMAVLVVELDT